MNINSLIRFVVSAVIGLLFVAIWTSASVQVIDTYKKHIISNSQQLAQELSKQ